MFQQTTATYTRHNSSSAIKVRDAEELETNRVQRISDIDALLYETEDDPNGVRYDSEEDAFGCIDIDGHNLPIGWAVPQTKKHAHIIHVVTPNPWN